MQVHLGPCPVVVRNVEDRAQRRLGADRQRAVARRVRKALSASSVVAASSTPSHGRKSCHSIANGARPVVASACASQVVQTVDRDLGDAEQLVCQARFTGSRLAADRQQLRRSIDRQQETPAQFLQFDRAPDNGERPDCWRTAQRDRSARPFSSQISTGWSKPLKTTPGRSSPRRPRAPGRAWCRR